MNCPHHHLIFGNRRRSYRELPIRLAEYGQVYREKSKKWQELRQHYDDITQRSVAREKRFFERISTDHALLTIGLSKDLIKAAVEQKARGWTATPALLEKMGVNNIKFISSPWQPGNDPRFPLLILQ